MEKFRLNRSAARVVVALLVALAVPAFSVAQMTRGSIAGTVRDTSGAVVPGATVTVTSVSTNAVQTVVTDGEGFYRAPALEPGRYTVATELSGFRKVEQRDVDVRTALETPLDVKLDPAGVGESVQVTAEPATAGLNKTNGTIATTIGSRAVEELPLPGGRNINNLVLTVPNAQQTTGQGMYAVNGNRPRNNNYMVDGSDNNDISVTIATSQIVPESVAEFQVLQNPYSVEFGRNSGGQINVITKSGSNRYAGDFFDFYQAAGMNSLTNLEKASGLETPAKFIRHQLGGDLGGPVMRDKAFFYGLYQRDSQHTANRPSGTTVRIPTQAGFATLSGVPLRSGQSAASRQGVLEQIGFLRDVYSASPVFRNLSTVQANGVGIETGQTNVAIQDPSMYHTGLGRVDFRPWASDNFTGRYSLNDRFDENGTGALGFGSLFAANQDLVDTNFALSNSHIFSGNKLNEFRFSLVRRDLAFPENDPNSPSVTITGLFNIGGASNFPQGRLTNAYQFSDVMTWNADKHSLKFGADIRLNDVHNEAAFDSKGTFTFNNLEDYLNNNAFSVAQALQTASFDVNQWQSSFFVQDDFRVRSDLTVNAGIRYEISDVPLGLFGSTDPQVRDALVPGPAKKDRNNWAPRAGFAWSPRFNNWLIGDGKSVVRGGFGVGYDVLFYNLLTVYTNPNVNTITQNNVFDLYPNKLASGSSAAFNPLNTWTNAPEDVENPESRFYSLSFQREAGNYLFEVGYSGSRGAKGINQIHANPAVLTPEQAATVRAGGTIPSVQQRRVYPQFGVRTVIPAYVGPGGNDVEAKSEYNAIFVSANRRLSHGLQMNSSYTFSKWRSNNDASLGEGGTESASQRPQNMFDYDSEWSVSNFDRPHRLALSYIYEIPGPHQGWLNQVIGGWQFSGVTSYQSGRPFTILTGVDTNGDANTGSDRPDINPSGSFTWDADHRHFTNNGYYVVPLNASGTPLLNGLGDGNAPRNTERMAAAWNTDFALFKRFTLAGTTRFIVRVDAFNALNQDNYGGAPNTTVPASFNQMNSPSFGQNNNNWGRRIIQLSGKFTF
jgi:Carboxypeptidase regulatory-like domain/TonB dependent receptor-like, beta-barrel